MSPPVQRKTINFVQLNVNCHVAKPVHTVPGPSQKKELSPGLADCYLTVVLGIGLKNQNRLIGNS